MRLLMIALTVVCASSGLALGEPQSPPPVAMSPTVTVDVTMTPSVAPSPTTTPSTVSPSGTPELPASPSTPDPNATPNPIASAEGVKKRREEQVAAFLLGETRQRYAALLEASRDEKVKALFKPFLRPSIWYLKSDHGHYGGFKKSTSRADQIPKPISYAALQRLGVFEPRGGSANWFRVATDPKNDRGNYPAYRTEEEKQRYVELYRTFFVLAEFWVRDGTLAP